MQGGRGGEETFSTRFSVPLILPIRMGHELLAQLPRSTYVKDAGISVHGFSRVGKPACFLPSCSLQMKREHHLQMEDVLMTVSPECLAGLPPHSPLPRRPPVVRAGCGGWQISIDGEFSKDQAGRGGGGTSGNATSAHVPFCKGPKALHLL
uniref:Uncharacterized protein n=1 Tax=Pipistrellus kuhlii TaxID=59472 RepID=A0A7J7XAX6_PIPKU|nr:hypothetical protein mPipKuh1_010604 [Pipistrellus kuhlii]